MSRLVQPVVQSGRPACPLGLRRPLTTPVACRARLCTLPQRQPASSRFLLAQLLGRRPCVRVFADTQNQPEPEQVSGPLLAPLSKWCQRLAGAFILVPFLVFGGSRHAIAQPLRTSSLDAFQAAVVRPNPLFETSSTDLRSSPQFRAAAALATAMVGYGFVRSSGSGPGLAPGGSSLRSAVVAAGVAVSATEMPTSTRARMERLDQLYNEIEVLKKRNSRVWELAMALMEEDASLSVSAATVKAAESMDLDNPAEAAAAAIAANALTAELMTPTEAPVAELVSAVAAPPMRPSGGASRSAPGMGATVADVMASAAASIASAVVTAAEAGVPIRPSGGASRLSSPPGLGADMPLPYASDSRIPPSPVPVRTGGASARSGSLTPPASAAPAAPPPPLQVPQDSSRVKPLSPNLAAWAGDVLEKTVAAQPLAPPPLPTVSDSSKISSSFGQVYDNPVVDTSFRPSMRPTRRAAARTPRTYRSIAPPPLPSPPARVNPSFDVAEDGPSPQDYLEEANGLSTDGRFNPSFASNDALDVAASNGPVAPVFATEAAPEAVWYNPLSWFAQNEGREGAGRNPSFDSTLAVEPVEAEAEVVVVMEGRVNPSFLPADALDDAAPVSAIVAPVIAAPVPVIPETAVAAPEPEPETPSAVAVAAAAAIAMPAEPEAEATRYNPLSWFTQRDSDTGFRTGTNPSFDSTFAVEAAPEVAMAMEDRVNPSFLPADALDDAAPVSAIVAPVIAAPVPVIPETAVAAPEPAPETLPAVAAATPAEPEADTTWYNPLSWFTQRDSGTDFRTGTNPSFDSSLVMEPAEAEEVEEVKPPSLVASIVKVAEEQGQDLGKELGIGAAAAASSAAWSEALTVGATPNDFAPVEQVSELLEVAMQTEEFTSLKYDSLRGALASASAPSAAHKYDMLRGLVRAGKEAEGTEQALAAAQVPPQEQPPHKYELIFDLLQSVRTSGEPAAIMASSDPKYDPVWCILNMRAPAQGSLSKYDLVGAMIKAALAASPQPSRYDPLQVILQAKPISGSFKYCIAEVLLHGGWQQSLESGLAELPSWDPMSSVVGTNGSSRTPRVKPVRGPRTVSKYDMVGQALKAVASLPEDLASGKWAAQQPRDPLLLSPRPDAKPPSRKDPKYNAVYKYDMVGQALQSMGTLPDELSSGKWAASQGRELIVDTLKKTVDEGPWGLVRRVRNGGSLALAAVTAATAPVSNLVGKAVERANVLAQGDAAKQVETLGSAAAVLGDNVIVVDTAAATVAAPAEVAEVAAAPAAEVPDVPAVVTEAVAPHVSDVAEAAVILTEETAVDAVGPEAAAAIASAEALAEAAVAAEAAAVAEAVVDEANATVGAMVAAEPSVMAMAMAAAAAEAAAVAATTPRVLEELPTLVFQFQSSSDEDEQAVTTAEQRPAPPARAVTPRSSAPTGRRRQRAVSAMPRAMEGGVAMSQPALQAARMERAVVPPLRSSGRRAAPPQNPAASPSMDCEALAAAIADSGAEVAFAPAPESELAPAAMATERATDDDAVAPVIAAVDAIEESVHAAFATAIPEPTDAALAAAGPEPTPAVTAPSEAAASLCLSELVVDLLVAMSIQGTRSGGPPSMDDLVARFGEGFADVAAQLGAVRGDDALMAAHPAVARLARAASLSPGDNTGMWSHLYDMLGAVRDAELAMPAFLDDCRTQYPLIHGLLTTGDIGQSVSVLCTICNLVPGVISAGVPQSEASKPVKAVQA